MALTQRLQLRQSQALVMTPQLMQAIKLLQLSNLDLVAYVEAEIERNPLLDRSAEDDGAPALAEGAAVGRGPERGRRGLGRRERSPAERSPRRGAARYPRRGQFSRPCRGKPAARRRRRSGRIFGMGRRRRRRPRRRRLQSRSVRSGRNHARRLAARAAHACRRQSAAADDRAISDRSRRRGRLSERRS